MATRNLTKQYLDIRSATKANRSLLREGGVDFDGDDKLLNKQGETTNWNALKNNLPPVWVDKVESLEDTMKDIQSNIGELNKLHARRLMVNFETDESKQEREIDFKTQQITSLFHQAERDLKGFIAQSDSYKISDSERKVRENIQKSMAKRLQTFSSDFRATQKEYLKKLQIQKSTGNTDFDFLDKKATTLNSTFEDPGFSSAQMQIVDDIDEVVQQRDEEITKIAKSIEELAAIFKELAVLVIDQGTILDRIDYNMETAVEHAKEGVVQLQKAEENQKNAMAFRCIIVLILLIIIMIAILIWKHSPKKS